MVWASASASAGGSPSARPCRHSKTKSPTAPAVMSSAAMAVRRSTSLESRGAPGSRGGRRITRRSMASNASGSASVTAATRLIQSSWVGRTGSSRVRVAASKGKAKTAQTKIRASPRLVGSTKASDLTRLS